MSEMVLWMMDCWEQVVRLGLRGETMARVRSERPDETGMLKVSKVWYSMRVLRGAVENVLEIGLGVCPVHEAPAFSPRPLYRRPLWRSTAPGFACLLILLCRCSSKARPTACWSLATLWLRFVGLYGSVTCNVYSPEGKGG
jgi:hypothetical protein